MRHRQTKGSATDRLRLNHRVTPRLHHVGNRSNLSGNPTKQDLARAHGERDTKGSASHTPESGDIHAADLAAACSKWQIPCVEGRGTVRYARQKSKSEILD